MNTSRLVALAAVIAAVSAPAALAGDNQKDVTVVNTAANPVPVAVQGTPTVNAKQFGTWQVDFLGTPTFKLSPDGNTVKIDPGANTVQAQQSGPWNVGINGTPTVQLAPDARVHIASSLAEPVVTRNAGDGTPATINCYVSIPASNSGSLSGCYIVPTGKQLNIEAVSASGYVPSGQRITARLTLGLATSGGGIGTLEIPFTYQGDFHGFVEPARFVGTIQTSAHAQSGADVDLYADRSDFSGQGVVLVTIFGRLVDA
jgi:hypothetical protein